MNNKFKTIAKGKSTRELKYIDEVYATLEIDEKTNSPLRLTIMHINREPVILSKVDSMQDAKTQLGNPRKLKAAQWITYHDPYDIYLPTMRENKALERYKAHNTALKKYSPETQIGRYFTTVTAELYEPLSEKVEQLELEKIEMQLKIDNAILRMDNAVLRMEMMFNSLIGANQKPLQAAPPTTRADPFNEKVDRTECPKIGEIKDSPQDIIGRLRRLH